MGSYGNLGLEAVARPLNFFLKLELMLQEGGNDTFVSISVTYVVVTATASAGVMKEISGARTG